jgi:hypothetical protein
MIRKLKGSRDYRLARAPQLLKSSNKTIPQTDLK